VVFKGLLILIPVKTSNGNKKRGEPIHHLSGTTKKRAVR
jgi:hypothetical protein